MTSQFKVGKTYKTRDNADALIIAVDTDLLFPIVGILTSENGLKQVFSWTIDGLDSVSWPYEVRKASAVDLVKPEPIVKTLWLNVFKSTDQKNDEKKSIYFGMNYDVGAHNSKEEALDYITLLNLVGKPQYVGTFPFSFEVSDE